MRVRSIYYQPKPKPAKQAPPGPSAVPAQILSARDAATYIGMSDGWLKKSRTKRGIGTDAPPFVRAGARRILYRRKDLDEWIEAHVNYISERIEQRVFAKLEAESEPEQRRNPVL